MLALIFLSAGINSYSLFQRNVIILLARMFFEFGEVLHGDMSLYSVITRISPDNKKGTNVPFSFV